jgi:hypothetical protein
MSALLSSFFLAVCILGVVFFGYCLVVWYPPDAPTYDLVGLVVFFILCLTGALYIAGCC